MISKYSVYYKTKLEDSQVSGTWVEWIISITNISINIGITKKKTIT